MDPYFVGAAIVIVAAIGWALFWPRPAAPAVAHRPAGPPPQFADAPRAAVPLSPREKALQIVRLQRELGDEAEAADWERSAGAARLHGHRAAQQAAWNYTPAGFAGGQPPAQAPN